MSQRREWHLKNKKNNIKLCQNCNVWDEVAGGGNWYHQNTEKKSQFHKPQYNYKLKTLIIGASGKIGRYLLELGNINYVYTYNKRTIHKGIHFDITKNNLNRLCKKFSVNKIVLLSGISDPDEC